MKLDTSLFAEFIPTLIKGDATTFNAIVLDVASKTIHLQLNDAISARVPVTYDKPKPKKGDTLVINKEGEVVEVLVLKVSTESKPESSRRSPDVKGMSRCSAPQDR